MKREMMKKELECVVWGDHDENDERARMYLESLMNVDIANRPLHVLHEMSRLNAELAPKIKDSMVSVGIDDRILDLCNAMGSCERILRTPIYTSYTRHASRFLTLWCNALPMALYPLVGPTLTVPFSLVVSFVMFGIEDIGLRIEQPFSILPIWQYSDTVKVSTDQQMKQYF